MNIVVAAEEAAGVQTVRLAAKSPHHLVAVLTSSGREETDGRGATVSSVARELGVAVFPAASVRDPSFADELRRQDVDVLLNVHSLYLISAEVLAAPRIGSFNLHPGPLPEYAGLNVPSWAIYNGENEHGVTLHWMHPQVDAGPVAFSATFPITERDTGASVTAKSVQHGIPLVSELLTRLSDDPATIPRHEQDMTRRRYFGKKAPHWGRIPWRFSAKRIVDFVRASDYGPWPSPWELPRTRIRGAGTEVGIGRVTRTGASTSAAPGTIGRPADDCVPVATGDEWVFVSRTRVHGRNVPPATALGAGDVLEAA